MNKICRLKWVPVIVLLMHAFMLGEAIAGNGISLMDLLKLEGKVDDPMQTFLIVDENGDGHINRTEFRLRKLWAFDKKDINRDKHLSHDEIPVLTAFAFGKADKNSDGKLSANEFNQAEFVNFEFYDKNKDSRIALDEFLDVREDMKN